VAAAANLSERGWGSDDASVWRRRPTPDPVAEVLELLTGIGRLMQRLDARLERIVNLLEEEYGREDES
jgi:hypothetical protein